MTWVGSFGVKDVETADPVTKNTVFNAASVSKPISAYLALTLCSRDELGLDDGIGPILGIDDPLMGSITPRQICDLMLTPQVELNDRISWSLGWGIESEAVQDGPWFWHHGRGRFTNLVIWSRNSKNGVVILTNTQRSETVESLERQIVKIVTGIEHPAFDFMPTRTMQKMGFLV